MIIFLKRFFPFIPITYLVEFKARELRIIEEAKGERITPDDIAAIAKKDTAKYVKVIQRLKQMREKERANRAKQEERKREEQSLMNL